MAVSAPVTAATKSAAAPLQSWHRSVSTAPRIALQRLTPQQQQRLRTATRPRSLVLTTNPPTTNEITKDNRTRSGDSNSASSSSGRGGCGDPNCTRCSFGNSSANSGVSNEQEARADRKSLRRHLRAQRNADRHLSEHGLQRVPIAADGNCMFHAIAAFFPHPAVSHLAVRRLIVDYIEANPDTFRIDIEQGLEWPSLEEYCNAMRGGGVWGDAVALSAFCMAQNVNIVVFNEHGCTELYPPTPPATRVKLAVVRVGNHYEATRVIPRQPAS